jgi:hypothetical protein
LVTIPKILGIKVAEKCQKSGRKVAEKWQKSGRNYVQHKKDWMMDALNLKYGDKFFKDLLLKAPDGIYEIGSRDNAPLWTGEDGLLKKCLTIVKQNIISRYPIIK